MQEDEYKELEIQTINFYQIKLKDPYYCQAIGLPTNLSETAIKVLSHTMALNQLLARKPKHKLK